MTRGTRSSGNGPLLARVRERDALVAEHAVAGRAPLVEVLLRQRLHVLVQRAVVDPGVAGRVEHLVPRVDRLVRVEEIAHHAHPGPCADRRRVSPMKQRYRLPAVNLTTALAFGVDARPHANPAERRAVERRALDLGLAYGASGFTDSVTPCLLDAVALAPGERVLDIGCGGGKTTIEAGRRVGPLGLRRPAPISRAVSSSWRVTGHTDRERGQRRVPGRRHAARLGRRAAPFDVAISQFGVMFFDEPVDRVRATSPRHLRAGGRHRFACWRAARRNPWNVAAALGRFLLPPPPPAPGKSPTGPFALADPARTEGILRDAGLLRRSGAPPFDMTVEHPKTRSSTTTSSLSWASPTPTCPAHGGPSTSTWRSSGSLRRSVRFPLSFQIFAAHRPA